MRLKIYRQGQGFPILCLHGHPGSGRSLAVFTDYLSQRFMTFAPDLRGYGQSRTKEKFQMIDHLSDLSLLLDEYHLERSLLLGWSLGGILAIELLLKYPERFTGLILVASAAHPRGQHLPVTFQDISYTGIAACLNWLKPGWEWNINTFWKRSLFRYLISQQTPLAYQYIAAHAVPAYLQTSRWAAQALFDALKLGYNRLSHLKNIQVPCLILTGSNDCHITARSSQETAEHLKNSTLHCYSNTAHLFPWEIPSQVLSDLEQWLEDYPEVIEHN